MRNDGWHITWNGKNGFGLHAHNTQKRYLMDRMKCMLTTWIPRDTFMKIVERGFAFGFYFSTLMYLHRLVWRASARHHHTHEVVALHSHSVIVFDLNGNFNFYVLAQVLKAAFFVLVVFSFSHSFTVATDDAIFCFLSCCRTRAHFRSTQSTHFSHTCNETIEKEPKREKKVWATVSRSFSFVGMPTVAAVATALAVRHPSHTDTRRRRGKKIEKDTHTHASKEIISHGFECSRSSLGVGARSCRWFGCSESYMRCQSPFYAAKTKTLADLPMLGFCSTQNFSSVFFVRVQHNWNIEHVCSTSSNRLRNG